MGKERNPVISQGLEDFLDYLRETEQLLRGTPLQIKFDEKVSDLIETIIDEGVEHHYALIHGDVTAELKLFAKWMGIQII